MRGAGLRDARLDEADLRGARLGGAFLVRASLCGSDLRGAYLRSARLNGTDLSDANLEAVEGLTQVQFDRARATQGRSFPTVCQGQQMAHDEHLELLRQGAAAWNAWRVERDELPDSSGAGLRGLNLSGFDLSRTDLRVPISEERH